MNIINRKANFEYEIIQKFNFGIALIGTEVKLLRKGSANIESAYLKSTQKHIIISNMRIGNENEDRIILCKKKEKNKLIGALEIKGQTAIALKIFWNKKGCAKVECALVTHKNKHDKRIAIKKKEIAKEIRKHKY